MKHVIAIPELAQRLGVDAMTVEESLAMSVRYPGRRKWVSAGPPDRGPTGRRLTTDAQMGMRLAGPSRLSVSSVMLGYA